MGMSGALSHGDGGDDDDKVCGWVGEMRDVQSNAIWSTICGFAGAVNGNALSRGSLFIDVDMVICGATQSSVGVWLVVDVDGSESVPASYIGGIEYS